MVIMIPQNIDIVSRATVGERKIFNLLNKLLNDNCIVWYDTRLSKRYPDIFVLINGLGAIVLEVKDWYIDTIESMDKNYCKIYVDRGSKKTLNNPLKQADNNLMDIIHKLEKEDELVCTNKKYPGKVDFAYTKCVFYTNITDSQMKTKYSINNERKWLLFKNDLEELESGRKNIVDVFRDMFEYPSMLGKLDSRKIKIIQECLDPKIIIDANQIKKSINLRHQALASSMKYKRQIIQGSAGTGKTILVAYRASFIAQMIPAFKILVLCYNQSLATSLRSMIDSITEVDLRENIVVSDVQSFFVEELKRVNPSGSEEWYENRIIRELDSLDVHNVMLKYDAILIDEAHDFREEYIKKLINAFLKDPLKSHLLLTLDGYQNIKRNKYRLSWVELNEEEFNNSVKLTYNYRNYKNVYEFSQRFIGLKYLPISKSDNKFSFDYCVDANEGLIDGGYTKIYECKSFKLEIGYIISELKNYHKLNKSYGNVAILTFNDKAIALIEKSLQENLISYKIVKDLNNFAANNQTVFVSTIENAKGLEFNKVFLCGIRDEYFVNECEISKLIYVGITRAIMNLEILISEANLYTVSLKLCNNSEKIKELDSEVECVGKYKFKVSFPQLISSTKDVQVDCIEDIFEENYLGTWVGQAKGKEEIISNLKRCRVGESVDGNLGNLEVTIEVIETKYNNYSDDEFTKFYINNFNTH